MTEVSETGEISYPSGSLLVRGGVEADNSAAAGGGSGGLARGSAVSAAGIWSGVSELPGGHRSVRHHHGDQTTIVFIVNGAMTFAVEGPDGIDEFTARSGDFAVVPAGLIHAETNPSDTETCLCVVVRTGEIPIVVNV